MRTTLAIGESQSGYALTTYANGVGNTVTFSFPTASGPVGSLSAHDSLTSQSALNVFGAFINDTWSWGKLTMNLGVRFDDYKGWLPEQEQLGGGFETQSANRPKCRLDARSVRRIPLVHLMCQA